MTVRLPCGGWCSSSSVSCFGRRRHRGLFYGIQQSQHPAGKLERSGGHDEIQHRQHLRSHIFRQGRGWLRIDGRCGSNSRRTACSLERLRTLGAADGAVDGRSIQIALSVAENLADIHTMFLSADRAGGVNVVILDVEPETEFFEIKHFNFLSAATQGRFPVFCFVDGGFFAPCMVGGIYLPSVGFAQS